MNQLEFLEMMGTKLKNDDLGLFEWEKLETLELFKELEEIIREHYRNYFTEELEKDYCQHYEDVGYSSWYDYFGDTDGAKYEVWMRELLTEEECNEIWRKSHNKKEIKYGIENQESFEFQCEDGIEYKAEKEESK